LQHRPEAEKTRSGHYDSELAAGRCALLDMSSCGIATLMLFVYIVTGECVLALAGGENEDDMSTVVYYLNSGDNRWEMKSEQMVSGVTETTIHSSYAVVNIDMDLD